MILMQLTDIMKSFAGNILLNNIKFQVQTHDRIAIVGRNGVGKSTLLKIMTGETGYDAGHVFSVKDIEIGYLEQQMTIDSEQTIWDEMVDVFCDLTREEIALKELAQKIEDDALAGKTDEKLINDYGRRQELFEEQGGYRYESDIRGVLTGLGFPESRYNSKITHLSGGQKTRLALGKLLLRKPDILFLDEPTNHLDIPTLVWLENYLAGYPGAIVIVSHDRYFLDKIVTIVYEVAHQTTHKYLGTYSTYLEQKALNYERDIKHYEKQQADIKQMEDFIQRNIARASTSKRAQSRQRQLEKMNKMDRPLSDASSAQFSFQINKTSGNDVVRVNDLSFKFSGKQPLLNDINFSIHRGERIALIGDNGIGKTTLLKLIKNGHDGVQIGTNVQIGFYDQEQTNLDPKNTVLRELWDDFPTVNERDIRTVLGNYLFTGDEVLKHVSALSGGEKARLSLAKLMLQRANFLILDEPTNHLDLDSKEVLEAALIDYPGTIFFVSHDRYFINKIADHVLELTKEGAKTYLGDFDYYIEKKNELLEIEQFERAKAVETSEDKVSHKNISFEEQKRRQSEERRKERTITELERKIEDYENQIDELEIEMTHPTIIQDHTQLLELAGEVEKLKKETEALMEEWTSLQL